MTEASDRKVALVALGIVLGGFFALTVMATGTNGILIVGSIAASALITTAFMNFHRPVIAWLAAMAGIALLAAFSAAVVSADLCSNDGQGMPPECSDGTSAAAANSARDWHGWPIAWRVDLPPRSAETDGTRMLISSGGVALHSLAVNLTIWFATAFVIEGVVIAFWRAVRRVRVHGTLFPAT